MFNIKQCKEKFITVVSCGAPTVNVSELNQEIISGPDSENYGGFMTVKCSTGFRWIDNSANKNVTCAADGAWTFPDYCYGNLR